MSWAALGLAALLLSALLAGCIPFISVRTVVTAVPLVGKACTQAGCFDTLQVNVQGELPQHFKISLTGSDGKELMSDCDLSRLEARQDACESPYVIFDSEYFLFRGAPTEVVLRIVWDEGSLEQTMTPAYEWFYPNGPGCAPKCKHAEVEVTIR